MICPKCGSAEIRSSQRRKWTDVLRARCGWRTFRCRSCRTRFRASTVGEPAPAASTRKRSRAKQFRPLIVQALILVAMFVIFFIFLRYLTREPTGGDSQTGQTKFRKNKTLNVRTARCDRRRAWFLVTDQYPDDEIPRASRR